MSVMPSSSSSLMLKRKREFAYGIFLSFHGKDTRKSFTGYLYGALTRQGIQTFRDDKSLNKGKEFAPELLRAIGESWGSIIVISKRYAFSRWCLDELVEIMKQRKERGHEVYPIFYKVKSSDFRHQINNVKEAFDKHEERYSKETMEVWRNALKEVTAINGWSLKDQYESDFIDDIVKNISEKFDARVLDDQEVEKMKSTFQTIQVWLIDAEKKQLIDAVTKQYMKEGEAAEEWLYKLKNTAYDMDDLLDEWNTATLKSDIDKDQGQTPSTSSSLLSEVPSTFAHFGGIALPHDIARRIKELNENYEANIAKDPFARRLIDSCTKLLEPIARPETISSIPESDVYVRDHKKDELICLLLSDYNGGGSGNGIPMLAIVGMGGIGKTTLAQLAFNNDKVEKYFHPTIWVCVSNPFDEVKIAKAIVKALEGTLSNELQSLSLEIRQRIKGKKFLLVLDDVRTEDQQKWNLLKSSLSVGSPKSKILVTTQNGKVAGNLGCTTTILLEKLSDTDGWSLFSKIAFLGRSYEDCENLKSIGRECVKKCNGLPLAIKTLASLLRSKSTRQDWQGILDSPMWLLDKVETDLFSPSLLSYFDLPYPLRQCFSYCAIFPKDHVIEKDLLIKLWMAQGFLRETQGKKMEAVGEEYFDNLAARSFFQEFEKDEIDDSKIIQCKMHDIVHEFAQRLRKTECCVVASSEIEERGVHFCHKNVRHLAILCDNQHGIPDPTYDKKKLRSLLLVDSRFHWQSTLEASLPILFDQLTCLRMLNLGKSSIKKLPLEMGKLIHLRYLSLEENRELVELPEALCDLWNLQTLNIRCCSELQKLPRRMEKLINLRHLQNAGTSSITFMPKGMQRLTCLQTLEECVVVKKGGGIESEASFSLADLGKLIHLGGYLKIRGLGNVGEDSEARKAQLSTKAGLRSLVLNFGGGDDKTRIEDEASVLQAIHPAADLQELEIGSSKSPAFPKWMISLRWLKNIRLCICDNWESLPPMGKLPLLESLEIGFMGKVKKVGEEFLGVGTSSSSTTADHNIAFPKLKELEFQFMHGWEEWEYGQKVLKSREGDGSSSSSSYSNIAIMPKLQSLVIEYCRELKMLPCELLKSTALQQLVIKGSPILYSRFNKKTGKDKHFIAHIPTVRIIKGDDEFRPKRRRRGYRNVRIHS